MSSSGSALLRSFTFESSWGIFLPSVSVKWRNKDHQTDLLCRLLYMSCKAVKWIFTTDMKVFSHDFHFHDVIVNWGIAPGMVPDTGNIHGKVLRTNCCTQVWLELTVSLDHLLSSLCLVQPEPELSQKNISFCIMTTSAKDLSLPLPSLVTHSEQNHPKSQASCS